MRTHLLIRLLALVLIVSAMFVVMLTAQRVSPVLDENAYRLVTTLLDARREQTNSWLSGIADGTVHLADLVEADMKSWLDAQSLDWQAASANAASLDALQAALFARLDDLMKSSRMTGTFIVFDTPDGALDPSAKPGLYVRTSMPDSYSIASDSYMIRVGSAGVVRALGFAMHQCWSHQIKLPEDPADRGRSFYDRPLEAYAAHHALPKRELGYWSEPFRLSDADEQLITYTVPLCDPEGRPIGVVGAEIAVSLLIKYLPAYEMPYEHAAYAFGTKRGGVILRDNIVISGTTPLGSDAGGEILTMREVPALGYPLRQLDGAFSDRYQGLALNLKLYGQHSPHFLDEYFLMSVIPSDELYADSLSVDVAMLVSSIVSCVIGILGAAYLALFYARSIRKLSDQVRLAESDEEVRLQPIGIRELDELSRVVESMSENVARRAARMASIVELVGMPMGAFEIEHARDRVYCTDSLFRILEIAHGDMKTQFIPYREWKALFPSLCSPPSSDQDRATIEFQWETRHQAVKWLRISVMNMETVSYGTVLDVTDEILQKQMLEYERDYDPLTKLLNRNTYQRYIAERIAGTPGKIGAMLFGDLDNLKFINDTYGHDMGDRYIQLAAKALLDHIDNSGVVARISGDEFVIFIYGYDTRDQAFEAIHETMERVRDTSIVASDGNEYRVAISVGVAFYPDDSSAIDELVRFADFAMYEVKHTNKGGIAIFQRGSFERDVYVHQTFDYLKVFLEERRVLFAYQPIVSLRTGKPIGYEALMRPQMPELRSPLDVLELARRQWKLNLLEKLVVFSVLEWVKEHYDELGEARVFINTITNQELSEQDRRVLEQRYARELMKTVCEVTEQENASPEMLASKAGWMRRNGMGIALDDYGTGYSSEYALLTLEPDYVKIDMSMVRDIDQDVKKQQLVSNTVSYARSRGIAIIAEGIEVQSELETLIQLGVEYVQGFYIARPSFEIMPLPEHTAQSLIADYERLRGTEVGSRGSQ